ncbi:MAG: hypothetical protein QFX35_06020 [Candidatus Verstraetearchaeota archaeon]|nr:hypothetical protein [Candidatus Verstraetearchaeota archaeon]
MCLAYGAAIAAEEARYPSSYRVKFRRDQFLELIRIAQPKRVYRVKNVHFFAFDGFVMYCQDCTDAELGVRVVEAVEFSNDAWKKA